jgi:hypothetical protein
MTNIINESGELTDEWVEKFRTYKRNINYPTLQDISNLMDSKVGTSTCQKAIANSHFATSQTQREIIAVAKHIGWRGYYHWR